MDWSIFVDATYFYVQKFERNQYVFKQTRRGIKQLLTATLAAFPTDVIPIDICTIWSAKDNNMTLSRNPRFIEASRMPTSYPILIH